jgi:hypothetical protein
MFARADSFEFRREGFNVYRTGWTANLVKSTASGLEQDYSVTASGGQDWEVRGRG